MRAFVKAVQIARFIPVVDTYISAAYLIVDLFRSRKTDAKASILTSFRRPGGRRFVAFRPQFWPRYINARAPAPPDAVLQARELTAGVPSSMHAIVHERKRYSLYELRENNMLVNRGLVRHRITKEIPAPRAPLPTTSRHLRSSVLHPSSSFRAGWDLILIGLVLYTAIAVVRCAWW